MSEKEPGPADFRAIIDAWPSAAQFGRDLSDDGHNGRIWRRRNRVPRQYHKLLAQLATARGIAGCSEDHLADLLKVGRGVGY